MEDVILYHVTPASNWQAIRVQGVRPDRSMGRELCSWWVSSDRLCWAMVHCAIRHRVDLHQLVALVITARNTSFLRGPVRGTWRTYNTIAAKRLALCTEPLKLCEPY